MTIAIDAREFTTTTGKYISSLIKYLQKVDTKNNYLILLKPEDLEACSLTSPRFTKIVCPHKEFTFDEQLGFKKQLDKLNPDLVHFGMVQQPVLYKGKTVTTMQDLTTIRFSNPAKNPIVFKLKQLVYKWVNKKVAKKSAEIITPSKFVKNDVVSYTGISESKITVTYESADPILDNPVPLKNLVGKEFIMYIGRPTPHKNLERLIGAFAEIQKTRPSLQLVLAGKKDANYKRIERMVEQRQIKNIIFTDFVSQGQLRWLYENCTAYIFPSLSEGFGLPGLEAMAHGAPVVSSNATCLPEIYGDAAHYFDPTNISVMAKAIDEVIAKPDLRNKLVELGKKQVKLYSWQRMAEQTLAVYKEALWG